MPVAIICPKCGDITDYYYKCECGKTIHYDGGCSESYYLCSGCGRTYCEECWGKAELGGGCRLCHAKCIVCNDIVSQNDVCGCQKDTQKAVCNDCYEDSDKCDNGNGCGECTYT